MIRPVRMTMKVHLPMAAVLCLMCAAPASADVRLPHIFGSKMVLQRDKPLPVWGWADPGEAVSVTLGDNTAGTKADKNGKWSVKLAAMPAGGPHVMRVKGNNSVTLDDILIGEVWICSGQSNMQWSVRASNNPREEITTAEHPNIRLFSVPLIPAGEPKADVIADWKKCSAKTVGDFSAVSYFFGRYLHKELDVPVGLINTSWGGTRIEPWTPPVGFKAVPKLGKTRDLLINLKLQNRRQQAIAVGENALWLAKARKALKSGARITAPPAWPQSPIHSPRQPTGLYNGMIHPLVPFAFRGAIWYQGESNNGEGMMYYEKMKALIGGWRSVWKQGDFPFLFVQLAPYKYGGDPTKLAGIWEAQTASLSIPNTGMAVTTDIGNVRDIHPRNKQDVGKRLALWALAKTYGRSDLVYSGPLYKSMSIEKDKIRLSFNHTGSGLASRDSKPLSWFTIAGEDGKFVEAEAKIDGNSVVVSSKNVPSPASARFGWNQLAEPNLMNKEGLPASPFRTGK